MATKFDQKNRWCKFRMTMTFMVVKGQQNSNIVNSLYGYQTSSEESLMQV